jgi:hypothetical protein
VAGEAASLKLRQEVVPLPHVVPAQHSARRTKDALAAAKVRGVKLGGHREQSQISKREAAERAEGLRSVFAELSGLSAHKAADELNRRGIPAASGGKWHAVQVIRSDDRSILTPISILLTPEQ